MLGRFLFGPADSQLDAIPADASILGFENRWQRASLQFAVEQSLPSGTTIRCLPPGRLLATKLEAFAGRGDGDHLGSPDFEDVVSLIDGREEVVEEVTRDTPDLRGYIATEITRHLESPRGREAIAAHLEGGRDGRSRAEAVTIPRFLQLAEAAPAS